MGNFNAASLDNFLIGVTDKLYKEAEKAKSQTTLSEPTPSYTRQGTVVTDNADGSYVVATHGNDEANTEKTYDGVRPWDSSATYNVGDRIQLNFNNVNPVPWIASSGGVGGAVADFSPVIVSYLGFIG